MTQSIPKSLLLEVGIIASCLMLSFFLSAQSVQWEKSFGGTYAEYDNNLAPTADGGYVMVGAAGSKDHDVSMSYGGGDYWIVKLDVLGSIQWEKSYGGTDYDVPTDVQQTADGGYIIVGYSISDDIYVSDNYGSEDYWVVRLDASGNLEWEKNYGGSEYDRANAVVQTSDGGYLVAGSTGSSDHDITTLKGGWDCWLIKLDTSGNLVWDKSYGGSGYEEALAFQPTNDGGYVMAGTATSDDGDVSGNNGGMDYWVVKIDDAGNIHWEQNYGGGSSDWAWAVQQTLDGGYIVAGHSTSDDQDVSGNYGDDDYWVVKIDSAGSIQWEQNYGGSGPDWGRSILQTPDGGYVFSGLSKSNDFDVSGNYGNNDYWLLRLDQSGNIVWEQNYGGSNNDVATDIILAPDGDIIVAGQSNSVDNDISGGYADSLEQPDLWVIKVGMITGIIEDGTNPAMRLYPNPTEGRLSVDLGPGHSSGEALISNALGQVIQKRYFRNSQVLDLEITGASGLYFIQIHADGRQPTTLKAIKF